MIIMYVERLRRKGVEESVKGKRQKFRDIK
jgi:hypothetical protein